MFDYFIPLLGATAISFSMVLAKLVLRDTDAGTFIFFRSFAGLALSLTLLPFIRVDQAPLFAFLLLALSVVLVPFIMNLFFFSGVRYAGVGTQTAILQSTPIFVVLSEAAILNSFAAPAAWFGVTVILSGIAMLVTGRSHVPPRRAVLFGLAAAAINGVNMVILAVVLRHFSRVALIVAQNAAYATMAGGLFVRAQSRAHKSARGTELRRVVLMSLLSGLLVQVVFIYLKLTSIERLGSLVTSVLVLAQLPLTFLFSRLMLGERITPQRAFATVAIVLGALMVTVAH